uniref:Reverse transcriptase N-terminal domain-containing protein n=1 Tax=Alsidium seaforthii TaxID=2007182 RepID=A0A1Z1MDR1_9FLOR|nr:hypothetical protein [Bryothamnion seaforthii]ARW63921.1 hypothetical protein [Bryothamnion seaforthii]
MINLKVHWKEIPWSKINLRVYMLQKKIYIAAKRHNLGCVYKLQNYLIKCNESRLVSIKNTFKTLKVYYSNLKSSNIIYYLYKSCSISKILFYISSIKNRITDLMVELIKQHLIYISIKPTWTARNSKLLHNYSTIYNSDISYCIQMNNSHIKEYLKVNQFIVELITFKLNSYHYLSKVIKKLIYRNNLLYCFSTKTMNNLLVIVSKILTLDYNWYIFYAIKKTLSKTNYSTDFNTLGTLIKSILHKERQNKLLKSNKYICINKLLNQLGNKCKKYYAEIKDFVATQDINQSNKLMNSYINNCFIKKETNNSLKIFKRNQFKTLNFIINQYIYYCNLKNYYFIFI